MTSDGTSGPTSLDFWLGAWVCAWDGGHGTNRIAKEFDDHVVVERFEALEPERWSGMSVNVFDELHGWRQTWVDSTGNYWALKGRSHPEGFAFAVDEVENGRDITKRMVFSDIGADAFRWRWERSGRRTRAPPGRSSGSSTTGASEIAAGRDERQGTSTNGKEPAPVGKNVLSAART